MSPATARRLMAHRCRRNAARLQLRCESDIKFIDEARIEVQAA